MLITVSMLSEFPHLWFAAAVVTSTQSANVAGSPGQAALASAINNGEGVPPGSPITSESSAFSTNAPAFASSISGRKLKQVHQWKINALKNILRWSGAVLPLQQCLCITLAPGCWRGNSCLAQIPSMLAHNQPVTALLKSSCCDEVVVLTLHTAL